MTVLLGLYMAWIALALLVLMSSIDSADFDYYIGEWERYAAEHAARGQADDERRCLKEAARIRAEQRAVERIDAILTFPLTPWRLVRLIRGGK